MTAAEKAERDILIRLLELQLETFEEINKIARKRVPYPVLHHLGIDRIQKKLEEQADLLKRLKAGAG